MNSATKFENRASRSQGKHEGESSSSLCDRLSRTRDLSPRQLPTDHDYAVSTREYQTDQSSLKSAPAVAGSVLEKQKQQQKQSHRCAGVDGSLHIRDLEIDHVLPESLQKHPEELEVLKAELGLPSHFCLNSALNFLPAGCPMYDSFGFCQARFFLSRATSPSGGRDRVKGAALWRSS